MRPSEAREKFQLADRLYRDGKYSAALALLDELDLAFPNAKNVLYPKAKCLAKMGRNHEAHELCQKLKAVYDDPRADKLMRQMADRPAPGVTTPGAPPDAFELQPVNLDLDPGGLPRTQGFDDLFAPVPAPSPRTPEPEGPNRKLLYIGLGVAGAVLVLALLALPLFVGGKQKAGGGTAATPGPAETPPEIRWHNAYDTAAYESWDKMAPTLLFFYSASSNDATRMMTDTWKEPSIAYLVKGWTCIRIDMDKDPETAGAYEVKTTPTTIVENDSGEAVYRQEGYVGARDFYDAIAPLHLPVHEIPKPTALKLVLVLLVGLVHSSAVLYITLLLVRKLPSGEFLHDILSVSLVAIGAGALASACPCFGIFIAGYILRQTYEMELIDFVVLFAINAIVGVFTTVLAAAVLGVPYEQLLEFAANL